MEAIEPEVQIESELIDAIQPIRYFVLASAINHLFSSGVYDHLNESDFSTISQISKDLTFDRSRVEGLLQYLANENILALRDERVRLTPKGRSLNHFRGWYTMLIGGYGNTYLQIGSKLNAANGWATRDATQVGIGSCGISHFDSIPLTQSLMQKMPRPAQRVLDLGCGNGLYLVEFCRQLGTITALGVEKDPGSCAQGTQLIKEAGLSDRVSLVCSPVVEFLKRETPFNADLTVLGFVLHEILAQEGRAAVVEFLATIVARFPDIHLIVIEVDHGFSDASVMKHGLGLAYYNPYFLMHYFTCQRLERTAFWRELFRDAGLEIAAEETTDTRVDSTGLEVGFLLRRRAI